MFKFFFRKKKITEAIPSVENADNSNSPAESNDVTTEVQPSFSRKERRERRYERLQRRKLRWGVLRHYIMLDSMKEINHIAELKKWLERWHSTKEIVNEIHDYELNEYDFQVLRRFVRLEKAKGKCDIKEVPHITLKEYNEAGNPNIDKVIIKLYSDYEDYWDGVLSGYKRVSDKKKRLQYLIDNLQQDMTESIINIQEARDKISQLLSKYETQLKQLQQP